MSIMRYSFVHWAALLTAVRNSPCSCQFSVSLHPPQAALNSEPRPGRLLGTTTNQKLSPRAGKVAWRSHDERGMTQSAQVFFLFPLSLTSFDSSPASGGAFWLSAPLISSRTPF